MLNYFMTVTCFNQPKYVRICSTYAGYTEALGINAYTRSMLCRELLQVAVLNYLHGYFIVTNGIEAASGNMIDISQEATKIMIQ